MMLVGFSSLFLRASPTRDLSEEEHLSWIFYLVSSVLQHSIDIKCRVTASVADGGGINEGNG